MASSEPCVTSTHERSTTRPARWPQTAVAVVWVLCALASASEAATVFPGGNLAALRALGGGTLRFDHLILNGPLTLRATDVAVLEVRALTVSPSGSVGVHRETCEYSGAPDLDVIASGAVEISGNIRLTGRSGTAVTSGATCNQCTGTAGGHLRIRAGALRVAGEIDVDGGTGARFQEVGEPAFGCSGGGAGQVDLGAASMDLSSADISAAGGEGGPGYGGRGSTGAPGAISLETVGRFDMRGGSVATDGPLTFSAATTAIWAPFYYGSLLESIAGGSDEAAPTVRIVSPPDAAVLRRGQPIDLVFEVSDSGTGVKELVIDGLGLEGERLTMSAATGSRATRRVDDPTGPPTLSVVAYDNRGNQSSDTAQALRYGGPLHVAEGHTFVLDSDLVVGSNFDALIDGTLLVKRGADTERTLAARSIRVGPDGRILLEVPAASTWLDNVPSLVLNATEDVTIDGEVLLGGARNALDGEGSGGLRVFGASISVAGVVRTSGTSPAWNNCGVDGGDGGPIELHSRGDLSLRGVFGSRGGDSFTGYECSGSSHSPGDGGFVWFSYEDAVEFGDSGYGFYVDGGVGKHWRGGEWSGRSGLVQLDYVGPSPPPAAPRLGLDEIEPNGDPGDAQPVVFLQDLVVFGDIDAAEDAAYGYDDKFLLFDLYRIRTLRESRLTLRLDVVPPASMAILVLEPTLAVVDGNLSESPIETLTAALGADGSDPLPAGDYLVAVGRIEDEGTSELQYALTLSAVPTTPPAIPTPPPIPMAPVPTIPEPGAAAAAWAALLAVASWRTRARRP